jgi:NAD+ kinase
MKRVGFILRPDRTAPGPLLYDLCDWLRHQGHRPIVIEEDGVHPDSAERIAEQDIGSAIDLAVALGGDGTMLRAANLVADDGVPVIGINLGHLGFLSHFDPAHARDCLGDAIAGKLAVEDRMRMSIACVNEAGTTTQRNGLNEAVIHQGSVARLVLLEARLDGQLITAYRADGLIVATPTGSTAYNLAAGGPILIPGFRAMTITPICAHSLTNRPLVVSGEHTISVAMSGQSDHDDVVLTIDGTWRQRITANDRVDIRAARTPFRIFAANKLYFDILREKLHWGVRNNNG